MTVILLNWMLTNIQYLVIILFAFIFFLFIYCLPKIDRTRDSYTRMRALLDRETKR